MRVPGPLTVCVAAAVLLALPAAGEETAPTVLDPSGRAIKTVPRTGVVDTWPEGAASSTPAALAAACAGSSDPAAATRSSDTDVAHVDPCGAVTRKRTGAAAFAAAAAGLTIDRMTTGSWYAETYNPGGTLQLLGSADVYTLSDGSTWSSGAGTIWRHSTALERVELAGDTIRYVLFTPPYAGAIYQQIDYDSGDHSAQGTLTAAGPLVIEAKAGATTAVMRASARVAANDATSYGEPRFNYYSAVVGSVVPFELTYTLAGGATWQLDTFTRTFTYSVAGAVDFANPVSVPPIVDLWISGPAEVPDESSVLFGATVRYESGVTRNVTSQAGWTVEPAALASVQAGVVTIAALSNPREVITLGVSHAEGAVVLSATKTVTCVADPGVEGRHLWPMYQADARHSGFVPLSLDFTQAALRWQRFLPGAVNPVAGANGRVFATVVTYFDGGETVFALDAGTGDTLWSKDVGEVFSVNPPTVAYGTVYVQTGKGIQTEEPALRAYDAATGTPVFRATLAAQWERYLAPTVVDGKVYVNGGYYGGMYGLDAFSGEQDWFASLPQYDEWTPAVAGTLAYAYLGNYQPGLYAVDRFTGRLVFFVADPAFEWDGWSMGTAPVVSAADAAVVAHDGRLVSFDTALRRIRWQVARAFRGQVSVAGGRLYAIDGARVAVLDERSGADLWSWQPPAGTPQGAIVVTNGHLLVSTATHVYAVDLATRQTAWSYAAAGELALADGNLYVAGATGALTAIRLYETIGPPTRLEISGPARVVEGTSAAYRAYAFDAAGNDADRTLLAEWYVEPAGYASMSADGRLAAGTLIRPAENVVVRARLVESGSTVEGTLPVQVVAGVSVDDLIRRNLERSIEIKEKVLGRLDRALEMERAVLEMRRQRAPAEGEAVESPCAFGALCAAIRRQAHARRDLVRSIELLTSELVQILGPAPSAP